MGQRYVIAAVVSILVAGCGGNGGQPAGGTAPEDTTTWLGMTVSDSIGVELGDPDYMFASIQAIAHGTDGLLYVLDRAGCCVSVYTEEGEFVRRFSREGSGPGEMINPLAMAVVGDGRIFVCSPWNGGIQAYSPEGEWLGLLTEFTNNPPLVMYGTEGNAYIASRLQVEPEGDELVCSTFIGRYEEGTEPVLKYWEDSFPFDPLDITTLLRRSFFGNAFSVDREGNVFISPLESDEYLVEGFRPDGERFLEISRDAVQVAKTEEEIREEKFYVETLLESYGVSGVVIDYEPDPFRNAVSDLDVDSAGRIWVRRGTERTPVFDVYDYDGALLFTASVPSLTGNGDYWDFTIDGYAVMAFSANPDVYQQIYLMELPETPVDTDL